METRIAPDRPKAALPQRLDYLHFLDRTGICGCPFVFNEAGGGQIGLTDDSPGTRGPSH